MAKRKVTDTKQNNIIRLSNEDFSKLVNFTSEELMIARKAANSFYKEVMAETNNPTLALKEVQKKTPIAVSYNYTVVESNEDWTDISISDDKEVKKLTSMFNVIKTDTQASDDILKKEELEEENKEENKEEDTSNELEESN